MRIRLLLILTLTTWLVAQTFEVVSVKPGTPGTRKSLKRAGKLRERIDDARVELGSQTLAYILETAYGVNEDQWTGPDWLNDARFDVNAKIPAGATKKDVPVMLQHMLADRFGLKIHHEPKEVPVYALVKGKSPLRLNKAAPGSAGGACDQGGLATEHICANMTMSQLANFLTFTARMAAQSWGLDRPVIDSTGIEGKWDFTMDYGLSGDNLEPIANAVKALGLKLEPGRHTFDHIVVDHIERTPTEN
jgi:uncharacterized protein (TIGR03435 family)